MNYPEVWGLVAGSLVMAVGAPMAAASQGDGCEQAWVGGLSPVRGVVGTVYDSLVWDDGSGPALYVAGEFSSAGNILDANNIARWDGESWSMLGAGIDGAVYALEVFDDGAGPALYAGGEFDTASGVEAKSLARWDGSKWSEVGGGVFGEVLSMTVSTDPKDRYLVVGGDFGFVGNDLEAAAVARWNGSAWHAYPDDDVFINRVTSLCFYDDGTGEKLYAGARFTDNDPAPNDRLRRWNGSGWEAVGGGVKPLVGSLSAGDVFDMIVFDDGSGVALYICGRFSFPDLNDAASKVARWNGQAWESVGDVVPSTSFASLPFDLNTIDYAGESMLVASGGRWLITDADDVNENILMWDGSDWIPLGGPMVTTVDGIQATTTVDFGDGPRFVASGRPVRVDAILEVEGIAQWDGEAWGPVGGGFDRAPLAVDVESMRDIEVSSSNGEQVVYAAGGFLGFGETRLNGIGRFEDGAWQPLGEGLNDQVLDIEVVESDGGLVVYAAGLFTEAGGQSANRVARWDGESWSALGDGFNSAVHHLKWFDDGSGPALYATGDFTSSGGQPVSRIARWDGTTWSGVGGGLLGGGRVLEVFDDGAGTALYVGGGFVAAGGQQIGRLARWDGTSWSSVGGGTNGTIFELTPADLDGQSVLLAGGGFSTAGGSSAGSVAAWDGVSWTPLGDYFAGAEINAIIAVDGDIFAGGRFLTPGPDPVRNIARWDGSQWLPVAGGLTGYISPTGQEVGVIRAMARLDGESGPRVLVGGAFRFAGDLVSRNFAALSLCSVDCPADVTGDDQIDLADLNLILANFGQTTPSGDTNGDGTVDLADLNAVLAAFGTGCP